MSLSNGQIRCHGCEYKGVLLYRPITLRYRLPGGETIDNHRTFGWCETCAGIRDVEIPLNASAIRLQISEKCPAQRESFSGRFMKAVGSALGRNPSEDQVELKRLNALLRLAVLRRSPPRCLTCGGTSVENLSFYEAGRSSNYVHSCGSRLYQAPTDVDAPRFFYRAETVLLDAEGLRLAQ